MQLHFSTIRIGWHRFAASLQPRRPCPAPLPSPLLLPPPSLALATSAAPVAPPVALIRPCLSRLAQADPAELPAFVRNCSVARRYLDLLGPLKWEHFPERDPHRPWPGPQPQPRAPYVAAFLVKLEEQKRYMSDLRLFLIEHPALVWVLGFLLVPSDQFEYGFDVNASLSSPRHFGRVLRTLPNAALQFLLDGTVRQLQTELPPNIVLGDADSLDTTHIIAWVKENNLKAYVKDRYDKDKQPKGDPDCRLGCKRKHNVGADAVASSQTAPPTPRTDAVPAKSIEVGEYYWGYASGVVATKVPDWGEFVLAELTQAFDHSDDSYFFPLMRATERRLGRRPKFGALDMAYDTFYVYEYFYQAGGFAAVSLSERGHIKRQFDEAGLPLCPAGLPMPLKNTYLCHTTLIEHERGRYACPLQFPQPRAEGPLAATQACPCADPHWDKGGCLVTMPTSIGARIRYQLDRNSETFKVIYKQRTATERINSQAKELGIERPKLRNGAAITNLNTLIYVLINLRAVHRVRAQRAESTAAAEGHPTRL
jgi:hypothetical protein